MSDRVVQIAEEPDWGSLRGKLLQARYLARNPSLVAGLVLLGALALFAGSAGSLSTSQPRHPSRRRRRRRPARPFRSARMRKGAT